MKHSTRILSVLLTLCMVLTLLPIPALAVSSEEPLPFTDVNESDWFYDSAAFVYKKGMMSGTTTTQFSPDRTTTRGMIVTVLHRLEGTPAVAGAPFTDVAADSYCAAAVSWASAKGVVAGYGSGRFGPNDPITREQMAVILYRYAKYKEYPTPVTGNVSAFADSRAVGTFAVEAMNWALGIGLLKGVSADRLEPAGRATRAQIAVLLHRFCQLVLPDGGESPISYTVTFAYNYDDKGTFKTVQVASGDRAVRPDSPSRAGYSFSGWYTAAKDGKRFDFTTPITQDITLYARWTALSGGGGGGGSSPVDPDDGRNEYTVTFLLNDGSVGAYRQDTVAKGASVEKPADPQREDYRFTGWYADPHGIERYEFSAPVKQDLFLYAGWGAPADVGTEGPYGTSDDQVETVYSVTKLSLLDRTDGTAVEAIVNSSSSAALLVEFLEDDGIFQYGPDDPEPQVLHTVSVMTPEFCEAAPVTIPVGDFALPQYFKIRATLYNTDDGTPLCNPFVCINYTAKYEEFDAKTIHDFEGQHVLNFDKQEDENFGVLADGVKLIESDSTTNLVRKETPSDPNTPFYEAYIFTNPDASVTSLQVGDIVYAEGEDQYYDRYLFKVGSMEPLEDGSIRIEPSDQNALTEYYTYLDVSTEKSKKAPAPEVSPMADIEVIDVDICPSVPVSLEVEYTPDDSPVSITGKLEGSIGLELALTYDAVLFGEDYFSCSSITKEDISLEISVLLKAEGDLTEDDAEIKLARVDIPTSVTGLTLYTEAGIPAELSLEVSGTFTLSHSSSNGFTYNTNDGWEQVQEKDFSLAVDAKGKIELKAGPRLAFGVAFLETVFTAEIGAWAGTKVSAELVIPVHNSTTADHIHACGACVKGEAKWFFEVEIRADVCIIEDKLDFNIISIKPVAIEGYIHFPLSSFGKFYISISSDPNSRFQNKLHFGGGDCPNEAWKVTFKAEDENGNALSGIPMTDTQGQYTKILVSGDSEFLYPGVHYVSASFPSKTVTKSYCLDEAATTVVLSPKSANGRLEGTVTAADSGSPLSTASVRVDSGSFTVAFVTTGSDGSYSLELPEGTFKLTISRFGYIPFSIYVTIEDGRTVYQSPALMVQENVFHQFGGISGTITDAKTGSPLSGVSVDLYPAWNSPCTGQPVQHMITDGSGQYRFAKTFFGAYIDLRIGNYTAQLSKNGYVTSTINVVVLPNTVNEDQSGSISPVMKVGEYRVVLRWGDQQPRDLDSHFNGLTTDNSRDHIYYRDKYGYTGNLDVDDTTYEGPETITVTNFGGLKNGFTYSVHDFTNRSSASNTVLANSGASVELYNGSELLRTYYVPHNGVGTVWNVFSVDKNGRITDLNTFESISDPSAVGASFAVPAP